MESRLPRENTTNTELHDYMCDILGGKKLTYIVKFLKFFTECSRNLKKKTGTEKLCICTIRSKKHLTITYVGLSQTVAKNLEAHNCVH